MYPPTVTLTLEFNGEDGAIDAQEALNEFRKDARLAAGFSTPWPGLVKAFNNSVRTTIAYTFEAPREVRGRLADYLAEYQRGQDANMPEAIAATLSDLRHICEEEKLDYQHLDALGYSHYCEENGTIPETLQSSQQALQLQLKARFPWLGTPESINFRDECNRLADMYDQLGGGQ